MGGKGREEDEPRYARYAGALAGERLPAALIDLDAFERNVDAAVRALGESRATIRVASKSLRCPELLGRVLERGGERVRGVLAVGAAEAQRLVALGFDDVLIGYPSAQPKDAALVAAANARARVMATVDDEVHVALLDEAARTAGVRVPVVIDVDVSLRALGGRVHLGARRSPLAKPKAVVAIAARVRDAPSLELAGVLAYESQVAGVADGESGLGARVRRLVRFGLELDARARRAAIARALRAEGLLPPLFDGGGSGSLGWSAADPTLTEVAVGSAFVCSHLFDGYLDLASEPAIAFALQVARCPAPGFVTCLGGGFIASGSPGPERLPRPWLPPGLALTPLEGAGEVQTPLRLADGIELRLGAPVFFRPAKAGELAEHFGEYLLIRGDRIEARAPTYRGLGISAL